MTQRALRARGGPSASSARPSERSRLRLVRSPRGERRARAAPSPRGRRRSRRPRAARAGTRSSTSGQAATSKSTPLLTISLPTNATSRRARAQDARAPRRGLPVARRTRSRARSPASRATAQALPRCPHARPAAVSRLARREALDVHPRRPQARALRRALLLAERLPQALRGVIASRRARSRRRPAPRGPKPRKRSGCGLDRVLERAPVDLHRIGHLARRAPAPGSPAPSRDGSPAPPRAHAARRTSRTAATLASM